MKKTFTAANDSSEQRQKSNILFALCFLAYTFSYFGRYNYSTCVDSMTEAGLLDKSFGGIISAAYLIFYGAGQFINGRLGVRVSPKLMVAIGLLGSGCSNLLMGSMSNKYVFLVLWAANGFFNSMLWSPIIRVFTDWMTQSQRLKAGANVSLTIPVGMTLSYSISALMLDIANWRAVFIACGSLLCIGGAIWIIGISGLKPYIKTMSERNSELIKPNLTSDGDKTTKPSLTLKLFFGTGIVFIAIIALFNGSLKDAVLSWAPTYLQDTYNFNDAQASLVSTLLPLFSVAGPYVAIFIDKHIFKNEVATSGVMFAVAGISLVAVVLLKGSMPLVAVALLALSMCCMWAVNTMILTFVPYRFGGLGISSAVTGTLNCTAYISASSCTVLYGSMAKSQNWSATVLVWTAFAICGAIACFGLAALWKKFRPENE
ncbi:MAG: MFS transporter [Clostridia bacterium]|nr:MFS transporter [Clostridia bacterium]